MADVSVDTYEKTVTQWRATCYECHAGLYAFEDQASAHRWAADHVCKKPSAPEATEKGDNRYEGGPGGD